MNSKSLLEELVVQLSCYEPAGASVEMSGQDLVGHTLVLGATGSGKTTRAINPILEQLIAFGAMDPETRTALVVVDAKAETAFAEALRRWCDHHGRGGDLRVVEADGDWHFDPFAPIRADGFEGISPCAEWLCAELPVDQRNRYWDVTFRHLVEHVLRFACLECGGDLGYGEVTALLVDYLLGWEDKQHEIKERIEALAVRIEEVHRRSDEILRNLRLVCAYDSMWRNLDRRTRTNHQSMAPSLLEPLLHPEVGRLLGRNASSRDVAVEEIVRDGGVLHVRLNASLDPEVAPLVARLVKGAFYSAVLRRQVRPEGRARMAGLILDDWSLSVTGGQRARYSDEALLPILRSRRGFVVAAIQSLAGLDRAVGSTARESLVANFANVFFFRIRDWESARLAQMVGGSKRMQVVDEVRDPDGRMIHKLYREVSMPAISPDALSRLEIGEAFVAVGHRICANPLSLVPVFGGAILG